MSNKYAKMRKNDVESINPLLPFALRKYPLIFKTVSDVVCTLAEACPTPAPTFECVSGTFKTFQKLANKKNRKVYAVAVLIRST